MITGFKQHPWVERVEVSYLGSDHALVCVTLTEEGKYAQVDLAEEGDTHIAFDLRKERHGVVTSHPKGLAILTSRPSIEVASGGMRYTIYLLLRWADVYVDMQPVSAVGWSKEAAQ